MKWVGHVTRLAEENELKQAFGGENWAKDITFETYWILNK